MEFSRLFDASKIALFIVLLAESPSLAQGKVTFPGIVHSVPSPDGSGARIFFREHLNRDGGQDSPVYYDDGHGYVRQIATMQRNMDVSWSPDGKSAFLEDNSASNESDCYALRRNPSGIKGASLLKSIERAPNRPPAAERRGHYYVNCKSWRSSYEIVGAVEGHTDTSPSHAFSHTFTYDLRSKRVSWDS